MILNGRSSTYDRDDNLFWNLYVMLSGALRTLDQVLDRQEGTRPHYIEMTKEQIAAALAACDKQADYLEELMKEELEQPGGEPTACYTFGRR
jgi:hypothetical protein